MLTWQAIVTFGLAIGIGIASHDAVTLSTIARCFNAKHGRMTAVIKVVTLEGKPFRLISAMQFMLFPSILRLPWAFAPIEFLPIELR